ncbi:hypothetical protein CPC08DRAFT_706000 [Agrocybe pediades]|nr:hypothetical protein CPC08DRAFT_706000 [Agrocybe pediades]
MSSFKNERHDERASQSGSEDGSYAMYGDMPKNEEMDEDPNSALTSQTLNPDGTPKRPMNAFMIFARRRRPQVSAENQSMRTGEISKILSKEWVSMPSSEKQFYLEQAKQLKENFNTRYPDYVYRRRPNNSRKRRRAEGLPGKPSDQGLGVEGEDGLDLEASPIEGDEHLESGLSHGSYSRQNYLTPTSLPPLEQTKYGPSGYSRNTGHSVHGDTMYRSNPQQDARMAPYNSDRMMGPGTMGPPSSTSPRMSLGADGLYSYGGGQQHSTQSQSPTSIYGTDPTGWQTRVDRSSGSWMGGGSQEQRHKQSSYPPVGGASQQQWSGTNNNENSTSPPSPNYFPTLNSPFYPTQAQLAPFQSNMAGANSSPVPPQQAAPSFDTLGSLPSSSMARNFTPRGYGGGDAALSPAGSYPPISPLETPSYPQRSRPSPSSNNGYPDLPPPSAGHDIATNGFWRE